MTRATKAARFPAGSALIRLYWSGVTIMSTPNSVIFTELDGHLSDGWVTKFTQSSHGNGAIV